MSSPDRRIWHYSANGIFSTSSAFRLAKRRHTAKRGTSVSPMDRSLWKSVWSLAVLPKLRLFLWQILHRILPTRQALLHRGLDIDPICPVFLTFEESVEHLLFACPLVERLGSLIGLRSSGSSVSHPAIVWRKLMASSRDQCPRFVLFWWRIWKSQNLVVFEQRQLHPMILHRQFLRQEAELSLLHVATQTMVVSVPSRVPTSWSPPQTPRLKINVDGAVLDPLGGAVG
ncbi:hypothetical protein LINGRAHAP2_LOCUS1511 [Linum grandiflorum]